MKSFSKKLRLTLLLLGFAAAGTVAWADTTYYLMWGTTNNITQFTSKGAQSGSTEWTWSVGNLSSGSNYYFCLSTSASYTGNITSNPSASDIVSTITSVKGIQEWNDGQVRKFYYFALSSAQSGVKLSYNSTTGKYTIFVGSTYTVTPSITGGSISPSTAQNVTSGSSVSFTVTPTSGYSYSSATYSGTKSGDIIRSTNTFTLTPTSSGTLTIVYSLETTYTITANGTNCSFNEASKNIAAGGSFDFVVTPNEGYKLVSASCTNATCSPTSLGDATTATTITVSNPTAAGTLTVVTAPVSANRTPTVRIGAKPSISSSDCGLTTTAYFAQTGCNNIDKLTLYYSNNRAFRIDGGNKTESKEISVSAPAINTSQNISLTSAEVSEVVNPGEQIFLRFTAHNANGTSSYSDILPIKYECSKFVKQNLTKSFKACPGEHQFNWNEMFIYPAPATWSVTLGGTDAKSDFTLSNGIMTWKTDGKTATSYTYTFTAHADGYDDATATLTINYTKPSGSITGSITGVTATPAATAENPTKPYTEVSLSAAGTTGNITLIDWTVSPATAEIYSESGNTLPATAKFKAESRATKTTYTVTATGYTATCASVSNSATIVVAPDIKEECD
jgi:hypothetical protein